jgi:MFS family permease
VLLLAFTVREPLRGAADRAVAHDVPRLTEVLRVLFARKSFVLLVVAACCQAFLGYAVLSWGATFLVRVYGMSFGEVGLSLGALAAVTGAVGVTAGGRLADGLASRDVRWLVWLSAIASAAAFPFAALFAMAPSAGLSLLAFAPFYLLNNMYVGPLWSLTQSLVHPGMRAQASATLLAVLNLVGYGVGPPLVGFINDVLEPTRGVDAIRYSIFFAAVVGACAAGFFLRCAGTLRQDLERARRVAPAS